MGKEGGKVSRSLDGMKDGKVSNSEICLTVESGFAFYPLDNGEPLRRLM